MEEECFAATVGAAAVRAIQICLATVKFLQDGNSLGTFGLLLMQAGVCLLMILFFSHLCNICIIYPLLYSTKLQNGHLFIASDALQQATSQHHGPRHAAAA